MYLNETVGVVVPTYNEEAFVGDVLRELPAFVDAIYLVDDASTDDTWRAMGDAMAAVAADRRVDGPGQAVSDRGHPTLTDRIVAADTVGRVTRLRHRENRGAGGAVKTGYLAAIEDGVDVIATVDGDGQMEADRLPALVEPVATGRAGYAKGDRFASPAVFRAMPPFRLVGNLLLTGLTRVASGYWRLSDPQNGFTAISRDVLLAVGVDAIPEYYGYMNDLVARLNTAGVRIAHVPTSVTYGEEESHIVYGQYVRRVSLQLLSSFVRRLRAGSAGGYPHPATVAYAVGAVGVAGAIVRLLKSARPGDKRPSRRAGVAAAAGLTALIVGILLDHAAAPDVIDVPGETPQEDRERVEAIDDSR